MNFFKKENLIILTVVLLIIPIFFGINNQFLLIRYFDLFILFVLIFGLFMLYIIGKIMVLHGYNQESFNIIKKHDVIDALINKKKSVLIFYFPITIVMEELIFRYYLVGIFANEIDELLAIFLSSIIFSLYHIHFWFKFKNKRMLINSTSYSFLLGLFNAFVFINLGLIFCILIHYFLVLKIYYDLYKKYYI